MQWHILCPRRRWWSFWKMYDIFSLCLPSLSPAESCAVRWKVFSLRAHENFIRKKTVLVLSRFALDFSYRAHSYWIDVKAEKKWKEEKFLRFCDNHNSHMFHSVDFRLLRLMFFCWFYFPESRSERIKSKIYIFTGLPKQMKNIFEKFINFVDCFSWKKKK